MSNLCELLTDSKGSDPKYSKLINDLIGRFETQKILFVEKMEYTDANSKAQAVDDLFLLGLGCVLFQPLTRTCFYKAVNTVLKVNDLMIFRFHERNTEHQELLVYSIFFERLMLYSAEK